MIARVSFLSVLLALACFSQGRAEEANVDALLYPIVIEARQTGNGRVIYLVTGKVRGFSDGRFDVLRDRYKHARDLLAGTPLEIQDGLELHQSLVVQGAAFPASSLWGICIRNPEYLSISTVCEDPVRWLKAGSELGDPQAMVQLGWYYARLQEPQLDRAIKWFLLAGGYREDGGKAALEYWKTKTTQQDIDQAVLLVERWQKADEQYLRAHIRKIVAGQ